MTRKLRKHQEDIIDRAGTALAKHGRTIVAHVAPGGGKSWLPGLMLEVLGNDWNLAWFAPRLNLASQAAQTLLDDFGMDVRRAFNGDVDPLRGLRGIVTTHQSLESDPAYWRHTLRKKWGRKKWLVVFDELHHAAIRGDGASSTLTLALHGLPYDARLLMTGTLDRASNTERIYGIDYTESDRGYEVDGESVHVRYSRADGLEEDPQAIVPVVFEHHDGEVKWKDLNTGGNEGGMLSGLGREDEGAGALTAVQTQMGEELLRRGLSHWRQVRGGKVIVVCALQSDAKRWLSVCGEYGISVLAISDQGQKAQDAIKSFRRPDGPSILVTVAMAYEGLDVKEITHGICLTNYRSAPWLEQMMARAWRSAPGKTKCYWFVPDDPRMNRAIAIIQREQSAVIGQSGNAKEPGESSEWRPQAILPVGSETAAMRISGLDSDDGMSLEQIAVFDAAISSGIDRDDPDLAALIAKVKPRINGNSKSTYDDREGHARRDLTWYQAWLARDCGMSHKEAGYKVNEWCGVRKRSDATIKQLERGLKNAQEFHARQHRRHR